MTSKIDFTTYADGKGKHAYDISTNSGRFIVHAATRAQAAARLRRAGFEVRDVNMIG